MNNHSSRRDRRRFLQESMFATMALSGGMGVQPSAFAASPQQARAAARNGSSKSLSRQFAEWVVRLRYEDLPADVVDRAKGLTLQNISSALLGAQLPAGRQAINFITEEESGITNGATILVTGTRVTRGGAAFANSELMLAGGKWDTFRMLTHPGTAIIPGALAAAESQTS